MKKKLKQIKFPFQIQIDDVSARSGFVVGNHGVTEIIADGSMALIRRETRPDLVVVGSFYGVEENAV